MRSRPIRSSRVGSAFCLVLAVAAAMMAVRVAPAGTIYFADIFYPEFTDGSIKKIFTDGTGLETLLVIGGGLRAIDVDLVAGKIYWSDVNDLTIKRCNLDGTGEEIVLNGVDWASSMVLDPLGGVMYWGDQVLGTLERSDLEGNDSGILRSTPFHIGIDLDRAQGKLYWSTSIDLFTGDLVRSDLDGNNLETVITDLDKPARLAVDAEGGKVYWTDYVIDIIRRANLDGTDVQDIYVVGSNRNPRGISLDLISGHAYWGQDLEISGTTGEIMRMELDGLNPIVVADGFGLVNDLVVVPGLVILEGPEDQVSVAGDAVSFSVLANGTDPIEYQWRKDGVELSDGGPISGATSSTLVIEPVALEDAGLYDVVVSNAEDTLTSEGALLTVFCAGDVNHDGLVDPLDVGFVQSRFGCQYPKDGQNCLDADANRDGTVDPLDSGYVLSRLGTCP